MPLAPATIFTPCTAVRVGRLTRRCIVLYLLEDDSIHLTVAFHRRGLYPYVFFRIRRALAPLLEKLREDFCQLRWDRPHPDAAHVLVGDAEKESFANLFSAIEEALGWSPSCHSCLETRCFKVAVPDAPCKPHAH